MFLCKCIFNLVLKWPSPGKVLRISRGLFCSLEIILVFMLVCQLIRLLENSNFCQFISIIHINVWWLGTVGIYAPSFLYVFVWSIYPYLSKEDNIKQSFVKVDMKPSVFLIQTFSNFVSMCMLCTCMYNVVLLWCHIVEVKYFLTCVI